MYEPMQILLAKREKRNIKLTWNEEQTNAFRKIKSKFRRKVENKHFDAEKDTYKMRC